MDGAVAFETFRAAAQDGGVARLEAQPARVRRHVRPAFIDHADHAQGNADARDLEPIRPLPRGDHAANGVGQGGDLFKPARHGFHAGLGQREPVDEGGGAPSGLRPASRSRGVGFENMRHALAQRRGGGTQGAILLLRGCQGKHARGGLRLLADGESSLARPSLSFVSAIEVIASTVEMRLQPRSRSNAMSSRWMSAARPA